MSEEQNGQNKTRFTPLLLLLLTFSGHDFQPQTVEERCFLPLQISLTKTTHPTESFLEYSALCGFPETRG